MPNDKQKPSERIKELYNDRNTRIGVSESLGWIEAMLRYLDEQWEKSNVER